MNEYHVYEIDQGHSEMAFRQTTPLHVREEVFPNGFRWFEVRHGIAIFGCINDKDCWIKNPFSEGFMIGDTDFGIFHHRYGWTPPIIVGEWMDNIVDGCGETLEEAIADLHENASRICQGLWV